MTKRAIAVPRSTEGHRANPGEMRIHKSSETARSRGRPTGSKNKSKSIVPKEVANEILDKLKPVLPQEHYDYMRGVIAQGKKVNIERELDVIIMLLNRQLIPAIIVETDGEAMDIDPEIAEELKLNQSSSTLKMPAFSKSVSERLKVVQSFMDMKLRLERQKDENKQEREQPILTVFAKRGLDIDRLGIIASAVPSGVGGGADNVKWTTDTARAVSDTVPQRQVIEQGGSQGETDWVLDGSID